MKPLTRYAMGTGMNVEPHMAPWPEGKYYRVDQVDARIAELEAERDAARADAEREAKWREQLASDLACVIGRERARCEELDEARADAEGLREALARVQEMMPPRNFDPYGQVFLTGRQINELNERLDAAIDAARGAA